MPSIRAGARLHQNKPKKAPQAKLTPQEKQQEEKQRAARLAKSLEIEAKNARLDEENKQKKAAEAILKNKKMQGLVYKALEGDIEAVNALLQAGEDVNQMNDNCETALISASAGDHPELVAFLLEQKGIDVNLYNENRGFGMTALHMAADGGYTDIVKLLINHDGIDLELPYKRRKNEKEIDVTALQLAKYAGRDEVVALLIGAGAQEPEESTCDMKCVVC